MGLAAVCQHWLDPPLVGTPVWRLCDCAAAHPRAAQFSKQSGLGIAGSESLCLCRGIVQPNAPLLCLWLLRVKHNGQVKTIVSEHRVPSSQAFFLPYPFSTCPLWPFPPHQARNLDVLVYLLSLHLLCNVPLLCPTFLLYTCALPHTVVCLWDRHEWVESRVGRGRSSYFGHLS